MVRLQRNGKFALSCPKCNAKIPLFKKDIYLDIVMCTTCNAAVRNPIGTRPVYIEVDDSAGIAEDWEDVGLGVWEELLEPLEPLEDSAEESLEALARSETSSS